MFIYFCVLLIIVDTMPIPQQYKFIVQLGKALHTYGVPSYKLQSYLTEIAEKKGIKGSFMDTPTWINYVFYEEDKHNYTYVECIPPGEINLGALGKVVEITNNVLNNKLSFEIAKTEIENIKNQSTDYSKVIELLSYMLAAGSFSIILNTNWISAIVATLIGVIVYLITLASRKYRYIGSTLESLVAFVATIITGIVSVYIKDINISMTILSSIIVFIPGMSITTALEEITSKSLVSGTAKLFDALISLFKQFFGVVLGLSLLPLFIELKPQLILDDIPNWVNFIAIPVLSISIMPVLKVRLKDVPLAVITGSICFLTTTLFDFSGILVSIFLGTLVAVATSKFFSYLTQSPRLVFLVPGIIMLVPGSKAFIGLSTMFLGINEVNTTNMGEQVLYIFMGIIGGLVFSGTFMDKKIRESY